VPILLLEVEKVEVYKFKRQTVVVKMTPEQKREFDVWCSQRGLKTKIAFRRPKRVYVEMDKKLWQQYEQLLRRRQRRRRKRKVVEAESD